MRLRKICTRHYKFGFTFRNGPTNVRKSGKGVLVLCGTPIIRLGGGWGVIGLRFDIQKMVKLHAPHTVEDAYKKALKVEKFNRPSSFAHTCQSMSSNGNNRPNNIRSKKSCLCNSLPVASPIESKASNSSIACHKCHHKGHIASRCP